MAKMFTYLFIIGIMMLFTPFVKMAYAQSASSPAADSYRHIKTSRVVGVLIVDAGISQQQARQLAAQYGLSGYEAANMPGKICCGSSIPPGVPRRPVPGAMLRQLPKHNDYVWRVVGRDLVLLNASSGMVAEVLYDVFK